MFLDADRNGVLTDKGLKRWEWGQGKKGAIILCNDDQDGDDTDPQLKTDNNDNHINGTNDPEEVAPLEFRRFGPLPPPTWVGTLSTHPDTGGKNIRIFGGTASGSLEILNSTTYNYTFPNLNFRVMRFRMEALHYPSENFDGLIKITFTIKDVTGKTISKQEGTVRVAPWMLHNHLQEVKTVYVTISTAAPFSNTTFRATLDDMLPSFANLIQNPATEDRWMQDVMEIGYSSMPSAVEPPVLGYNVNLKSPQNRPSTIMNGYPQSLLAQDFGFYKFDGVAGRDEYTLSSFGNLECSPPVTNNENTFPMGRIYHSADVPGIRKMYPPLRKFLDAQIVQAPVDIDTSWLAVGHVDEIMSFVPAPATSKGFKLLIASPRRAYEILEGISAPVAAAHKLLGGRSVVVPGTSSRLARVEVGIQRFLTVGLPAIPNVPSTRLTATHLKSFNLSTCQVKIDNAVNNVIYDAFGLDSEDIIEVPVLFWELNFPLLGDALTANMVNMLVVTTTGGGGGSTCIFPDPFGPVVPGSSGMHDLFLIDLRDSLLALGLLPKPIDDWYPYHVQDGEVHCGTNVIRNPPASKWWEFEP